MRSKEATPSPWYRKSRSRWYVTTSDGTQHALDRGIAPDDISGAKQATEELIAKLASGIAQHLTSSTCENTRNLHGPGEKPLVFDARQPTSSTTVSDAISTFLATTQSRALAGKITLETAKNYTNALTWLRKAFASRSLASLAAPEVEAWADRPEWSNSTQRSNLRIVQQLLRTSGIILPLEVPHAESRGADSIITDEQFSKVLAELRKQRKRSDLAELLEVLRETGARPSEIAQLKADSIDWANTCTRLVHHKTRRHTGSDRIIHFTKEAMRVLERQRVKYETGHLFRTKSGSGLTKITIARRLGELSERVGFRVIAYGLGRHSFATRALERGISETDVAALLGHKGTGMLTKHYNHVGSNAARMKEQMERASSKAG